MFKALVLVRNLECGEKRLDLGDFTIEPVGLRFKELRDTFSSVDVNQDDWVFEKAYAVPPPGPPGSAVGGIPKDVEDILLLLRLYKVGDIAFIKQAYIQPSGSRVVQFPYRAVNDLNSYSALRFELGPNECEDWKKFANGLRRSQSWDSEWFSVARRFFLDGGAREFNPVWDEVDRIVDYATAVEAAVVPESEFSSRRFRYRAALLASPDDLEQQKVVRKLMQQMYDIRSSIVHGSNLSNDQRGWLIQNCSQVEQRVREVLVAAVQLVPPNDGERREKLKAVYDLVDQDRAEFVLQRFQEIKTEAVRKTVAAELTRRAGG